MNFTISLAGGAAKAIGLASLMASQAAFGAMHVSEKTDFIAGENTNGWTISASQWKSPAYPAPVASFTASGTNLSDGATLSISY